MRNNKFVYINKYQDINVYLENHEVIFKISYYENTHTKKFSLFSVSIQHLFDRLLINVKQIFSLCSKNT